MPGALANLRFFVGVVCFAHVCGYLCFVFRVTAFCEWIVMHQKVLLQPLCSAFCLCLTWSFFVCVYACFVHVFTRFVCVVFSTFVFNIYFLTFLESR